MFMLYDPSLGRLHNFHLATYLPLIPPHTLTYFALQFVTVKAPQLDPYPSHQCTLTSRFIV